jgi:hypothetical protein
MTLACESMAMIPGSDVALLWIHLFVLVELYESAYWCNVASWLLLKIILFLKSLSNLIGQILSTIH